MAGGRRMGIVRALEVVTDLSVETLEAIEVIQQHYSNMAGVFTGLRIMKEHNMGIQEEDRDGLKH